VEGNGNWLRCDGGKIKEIKKQRSAKGALQLRDFVIPEIWHSREMRLCRFFVFLRRHKFSDAVPYNTHLLYPFAAYSFFENGMYLPSCVLCVKLVENIDERHSS